MYNDPVRFTDLGDNEIFFYRKSGLHFDRLFTAGVFKFIGNFSKNTKNQGHKTSVNTLTDTDTDTMRHKQVLQCD